MKKTSKLILTSALVFLSSCGESKVHKAEEVSIKDFEWTIQEGIVNKERYITYNFTNNSNYTIYEMELVLKPNKKMTEEKLEEFYSFFKEEYDVDDDRMTFLKEDCDLRLECSFNESYEGALEAGKTISNERCTYYNVWYAMNFEYAQYFTEDIIEYTYLKNQMLYTITYDFKTNTYSHEEPEEL